MAFFEIHGSYLSLMGGQGKKSINVLWFKRDLRLVDHAALAEACQSPLPLLMVYLCEPFIWKDHHYDVRHLNFVRESLRDMKLALSSKGSGFLCLESETLPFFAYLDRNFKIETVFSTQETGLDITYQRDIAFADFCDQRAILWREFQNNGVLRGLKNRNGWRKAWYEYMKAPLSVCNLEGITTLEASDLLGICSEFKCLSLITVENQFQKGGRSEGLSWADSFFNDRIANYSDFISKPENSREGCSRLSPYFAWGNLSIREIYQRALEVKKTSVYKRQLNSFMSRLRWQSHFIQKFEMEPRMEFEAVNRAFLSLEQPLNEIYVGAWKTGLTGYPLVDASLRCVAETGYINFRMRAMVTSFLTHHLFQHFRTGSAWLARQFLDFEAGIHYGQMQMQAGFTGTNTVRVYNPTKNALEHDAEAIFIKKYVPELRPLPKHLAIEPWKITDMEAEMYAFQYGNDYPRRIVDIQETRKNAVEKLYGQRKSERGRSERKRILDTHTIKGKSRRSE